MYTCSVLVVAVGRHVILLNSYGPSRICGPRARHGACSHVRAHRSDQGVPVDHPKRRERVPCTRGEESEMGQASRTQERMVVYQLICYKIVIKNSLQTNTLSESEKKHICFIKIIKVPGYISFFFSTSRIKTPELINMLGVR
jgi:hypothetical protein